MSFNDVVGSMDLFQGLDSDQVEELARIAVSRKYAQGEEIFRAGEEAKGFHGVASGKVRIYRASDSGKEQVLHVFGSGQVFGEVAVFSGQAFPAGAQALEDSEILFFPKDRFRRLVTRDPDLSMAMLGLLSGRLRSFVSKIDELSLKEVPARLAAHLYLLSEQGERLQFRLGLPKGQLASLLGTIQETLSRALRKLQNDGLVRVQGREVEVLDPEGLRREAERTR